MKDFRPLWAAKAQAKNITAEDMVDRCILKTMSAKAENKEELVGIFLKKAFTPLKYGMPPYNYRAAIDAANSLNYDFLYRQHSLFAASCLETADEWDMYNALLKVILKKEIYNGKD